MLRSKYFIILFYSLLFTTNTSAEKMGIIPGIIEPNGIAVSGSEVYILEGASVSVFSTQDLQFLRTFGREGQGPGELEVTPWLSNTLKIMEGKIVLDSINKIVIYSKQGELLNEIRRSEQFTQMVPLGDNFVVRKRIFNEQEQAQYSSINWFDPVTKETKELYRQILTPGRKEINMIPDSLHFQVHADKIFIEESPQGFLIEVFNGRGEKLYNITQKIKPTLVTKIDKNGAENNQISLSFYIHYMKLAPFILFHNIVKSTLIYIE